MERLNAKYYEELRDSINMTNLRKLIDEKNYTVTKVAMEAGLSDSTLYNFIKGQRLPSLATLIELARVLDTSTDYLLGLTDDPRKISDISKTENDENIKYLIQNILSLSDDKKGKVDAYVKGLLNS